MSLFATKTQDISKANKWLYQARVRLWALTAYNLAQQGDTFLAHLRASITDGSLQEFFWTVEVCPTTATEHAHIGLRFKEKMRYSSVNSWLDRARLTAWIKPMSDDSKSGRTPDVMWQDYLEYAMKDLTDPNAATPQFQPRHVHEGKVSATTDSKATKSKSSSTLPPHLATMVLSGQTAEALGR